MVRGRRKDLTAPPTRSVAHQRDYRERKAKYVADLEDKCRSFQEQNQQLLKENMELRYELDQKQMVESLNVVVSEEEVKKARALEELSSSLSSALAGIQALQELSRNLSRNSTLSSLNHATQTSGLPPPTLEKPTSQTNDNPHFEMVDFTDDTQSPATHRASRSVSVSNSPNISPTVTLSPVLALTEPERGDHYSDDPDNWDANSPSCCMGFFRCESIAMEEDPDIVATKADSVLNGSPRVGKGPDPRVSAEASRESVSLTNRMRNHGETDRTGLLSLPDELHSRQHDLISDALATEFRVIAEQSSLRSTVQAG